MKSPSLPSVPRHRRGFSVFHCHRQPQKNRSKAFPAQICPQSADCDPKGNRDPPSCMMCLSALRLFPHGNTERFAPLSIHGIKAAERSGTPFQDDTSGIPGEAKSLIAGKRVRRYNAIHVDRSRARWMISVFLSSRIFRLIPQRISGIRKRKPF